MPVDEINLQRMDMVLDPMADALFEYIYQEPMPDMPELRVKFRAMAQVALKAAILAMKRAKAEGRPGA